LTPVNTNLLKPEFGIAPFPRYWLIDVNPDDAIEDWGESGS